MNKIFVLRCDRRKQGMQVCAALCVFARRARISGTTLYPIGEDLVFLAQSIVRAHARVNGGKTLKSWKRGADGFGILLKETTAVTGLRRGLWR